MKNKLFRSDVTRGMEDGKIDREKGIIYGFKVVELGVTKDRRGEFDEESLKTIIKLGNASKIGIKSRYGHPNMSNTAFGTFLGRVRDFRLSDNSKAVLADDHLDKTAYKTPNGDLANYAMDLGESDPDAFGSSMVVYWDEEYRKEEDGSLSKDEKGETLVPLIRPKKLTGVDIVDDPAANEGMFGNFFSDSVKLSAGMTEFLDKFLSNPDAIDKTISFLQRYANNRDEFAEKFKCSCIKCGHKMESEEHCNILKCSECGGQMRREERPGPGQEKQSKNQNKGEVKDMEMSELTLDTLKADRSDLVDAIQVEALKDGNAAGVELERKRVVDIQKAVIPYEGMSELANNAIKDGDTADEALSKFKDQRIVDLTVNAPESQGAGDNPEKKKEGEEELSLEDQCKEDWKKDSAIRDEFRTEEAYIAFKKADARKSVKILKK